MRTPSRSWPLFVLIALVTTACADDPASPSDPAPPISAEAVCAPVAAGLLTAMIQTSRAEVDALEAATILTEGQARALRRHLDNAERQATRGEHCAVRDQLAAFRDQLQELVGDGVLTDREAYDLRHAMRLALSTRTVRPGDPEEYAPGAFGEVRTVPFGGEELTVEVIDGLALFNGDMILGFVDELEGSTVGDPDGPAASGPCRGCTRWTGSIGFSYADDWGDPTTNAAMRARILAAVNHLRANTGFEFHEQHSNPDLLFRNSMGCSSPVGRRVVTVDPHTINLGTGCGFGSVVHEILHSLGIFHEQARNDRNSFVMVVIDNVRDGREHNFNQFGSAGSDLGPYEYGSIMHYGCGDFRADDATGDPITPLAAGVTCADLRQRDSLTVLDIAGAYLVDEVDYSIVGADPGEVGDRFDLALDWVSEPVDPSYIQWDVIGLGVLGTGPTFSTADAGLANGDYWVRVSLAIGGVTLYPRDLRFTIANSPPSVDLGADITAEQNQSFTLTAAVTDAEDGLCPVGVCTFAWSPDPRRDLGGSAEYLAASLGTATYSVTVTDGAGATGTDAIDVTVVNSPPTPVIELPVNGSTFNPGSSVDFSGFATDPNWQIGGGARALPCDLTYYRWASSDPSDVLTLLTGCQGTLTFGNPGTRTLTLSADDGDGNVASTSVTLEVQACGASGCPPEALLTFDDPAQFTGADYGLPFTEPGYYLDTPIRATAGIRDPDGPPTALSYEWWVQPPCFGGCADFQVDAGTLFTPSTAYLNWTPSADPRVSEWSNCVSVPLPFVIRLQMTDGAGNARTVSRTIYLACPLR